MLLLNFARGFLGLCPLALALLLPRLPLRNPTSPAEEVPACEIDTIEGTWDGFGVVPSQITEVGGDGLGS